MENNKRLKIGLFLDNFYPNIDGVVLVVDNLAKMLSKFNDVVVVVPDNDSSDEDFLRPYKVIRISSISIPFTEYFLGKRKTKVSKEFRMLLDENFDIIHIHSPFTIGRLGQKIATKLNVPCIATMHTRFDFEIRKIINNKLVVKTIIKNIIKVYNRCDNCIAINRAMIKVFNDYGYNGTTKVIYNGTDLLPLKEQEKEKRIEIVNKLYDLKPSDTLLIFVGRITDIKNIFFILDSLKLLKEENFPFKMLYVGSGPDEKKLKEKIKEYELDKDVKVIGRITDREILSGIYARASLLLFPSLFDASSLVQIEAAVHETPGLFISGSVTSDTVTNGVNGFTSEDSVFSYKDKIKEILEDKKRLEVVSKNAQKMLGKNWSDIALDTYEFYLEEINKKNS